MKHGRMIFDIGQALLVLGSALYIVELLPPEVPGLVAIITGIYAVSIVMMLIGWFGTKEERAARKAAKKAAKKA